MLVSIAIIASPTRCLPQKKYLLLCATHSRQKFLNGVGDISVYLTVPADVQGSLFGAHPPDEIMNATGGARQPSLNHGLIEMARSFFSVLFEWEMVELLLAREPNPHHSGMNIGIASPPAALRKTTRTGTPIFSWSNSQSTRFVSMLTPSSSVT